MTTDTSSSPKPHINGVQAPAISKQDQVPTKFGQTRKGNGQMPTADARLPSPKQ